MDTSNRKATTTETILRNITLERDSAVSQLGVAYVTIKQLEAENEDLKEENRVLRGPTQALSEGPESTIKKSRGTINVGKDQTKAAHTLNDQISPAKSTRFTKRSNRHTSGTEAKSIADPDIFDLTPRPHVPVDNLSRANQKENGVDSEESEASIDEVPRVRANKDATKRKSSRFDRTQPEISTRDLTYLSFLDSDEVAKLRRTLEQEHIERRQRLEPKQNSSKADGAYNEQQSLYSRVQKSERDLPRKSSMKDLTSRSINNKDENGPAYTERDLEQSRRHSEPSLLSTRSRRHGKNIDNMTSAFIVPDITIRATSGKSEQVPGLPKESEIHEGLPQHKGDKCMVCKSKTDPDSTHNHTITIPKPVPVSERVPVTGPYEEEPTVRPSQAPGLALATVIKGLEDEIVHLKVQLAKYQALYSGHDPALSKRKRKSVQTKIESLLQAIDMKSDQIYALYDVLESQKQDDLEMSEEEVEITLQSIGIDPARVRLRGGGETEEDEPKGKAPQRRPWDLNSDDEDDDLPWEGIESTVETTKNSFGRVHRRSAAV